MHAPLKGECALTFESKVKQIRNAEKDVDKVLKAARLERNPNDNKRLEIILTYITTIIGMFLGFALIIGTFLIMAFAR